MKEILNNNVSIEDNETHKNLDELKKFHDLKGEVLSKFLKLDPSFATYRDRIAVFVDKLKKRYPDYEQYELFHHFASKTFEKNYPKFDFPGEDSVFKFFEKLNEELNKNQ